MTTRDKPKSAAAKELKGNSKLISTLRSAVNSAKDEEGWARLGSIGSHIANMGPFDHRTYGFKRLVDLFSAIDLFEVRQEKNGNQTEISVRMKRGSRKPPAVK